MKLYPYIAIGIGVLLFCVVLIVIALITQFVVKPICRKFYKLDQ